MAFNSELLQQAFGLGLHVALDPLRQHAEKEGREKIKPGAKRECPTPLHQHSAFASSISIGASAN